MQYKVLFEIRYENSETSGDVLVPATTRGEALQKFDECWSQYGDEVPSRWIIGVWETQGGKLPWVFEDLQYLRTKTTQIKYKNATTTKKADLYRKLFDN